MVVDDELIIMIRQNNEEAMNMLLERYENAMKYIVQKIYSKMSFCGLEKADLKSCAFEAFLRAIDFYDERKSCFYSFWKLITERELYSMIKKHNSKGNQILTHALSFDNPVFEEEGCITHGEQIEDVNANIIKRYEAQEQVLKLCDVEEKYFTAVEKMIIKKRMDGYSYDEIISCLNIKARDIDKAIKKSKKIISDIR